MIDVRRYAGAGIVDGRPPVLAGTAMVVTPDRFATLTGLDVLRAGGNAVDAAVAIGAALAVAHPHQCSLGGDAFWLVRHDGVTHALDASGRSAGTASAAALRDAGLESVPPRSGLAVTVPGVVSGWLAAHARFGSVAFGELLEPAAVAADAGLPLTPLVSRQFARSADLLATRVESRRVLLPEGRPPTVGERLRQPDVARTIRTLGEDPRALYEGDLAERLCAAVQADGGLLQPDDLAGHRADWTEPLEAPFAAWTVQEMPPSSQGLVALLGLLVMETLDVPPGDSRRSHAWVEVARLCMAVRDAELGDPRHMRRTPDDLLARPNVEWLAGLLDARGVRRAEWLRDRLGGGTGPVSAPTPARGDTVHYAVVDGGGMAVSCIQSVFEDFGSGIVVPGAGIVLHNRGAGFRVDVDDHPNSLRPAVRPMHTLAPALALADGRTVAVFGSMGGHAQAQLHMQLLEGLAVEGLDPATVTVRPRWYVQPGSDAVLAEPRGGLADRLEATGQQVQRTAQFEQSMGHAQVIVVDHERGVLVGAADPRSDGLALGY